MASLVLMLVLPPASTFFSGLSIVMEVTYGIVILLACIYTATNYRDLFLLAIIGTFQYLLFLFQQPGQDIQIINPLITFIFFTSVFIRITRYIFQPRAITANDIYAFCCGYLILGVVAAPFFFFIAMNIPDAFTITQETDFYEFLYFSYITLTTVGYGDIAPIHPIAKSFTLLLSIIGQLYLTVILGIIIGKYLSSQN